MLSARECVAALMKHDVTSHHDLHQKYQPSNSIMMLHKCRSYECKTQTRLGDIFAGSEESSWRLVHGSVLMH